MNSKKYFRRLYTYNAWANEMLYSYLREGAYQNKKIDVLFSHITVSQILWHNRITGQEKPKWGLFDTIPTHILLELNQKSNKAWQEVVLGTSKSGFKEMISYVDTEGRSQHTQLRDILTHVANHGTHHRGQIVAWLRAEGIAPPALDYILFTRA
ncbi:MAG: DinB family protein [Cyclobacteriaceae bacterium]